MAEEQTAPQVESEQSRVKSMLSAFRSVTENKMVGKAQTETIAILKNFVTGFRKVLDGIDKFLLSKGIKSADLNKRLDAAVDKTKELAGRGRAKLSDLAGEVKQKGFKGFLKDSAEALKTKTQDAYKNFTETANGPPAPEGWQAPGSSSEDPKITPGKMLDGVKTMVGKLGVSVSQLKDTVMSKLEQENQKLKEAAKGKDNEAEKSERVQKKEGLLTRLRNTVKGVSDRSDARKKEIETEKENAKADKGGGKKKGFLGTILGGISSAVFSGFKAVTTVIGPLLGSLIGRSIVGIFGAVLPKLIPGLSGMLGGTVTKALFGEGLMKLGKGGLIRAGITGLWGAAKFLGVGALKVGAAAVTGVGGAVLGGAVVAGLAIYGGYKLYKYMTRNDVSKDIFGKLTRLRLLTYGYNDIKKDHYFRLFELEMLMKDQIGLKNGRVVFNKLTEEVKSDILKLFEVKREEKDKYALFNRWFQYRFMPAYQAFMSALWTTRSDVYLDNLEKLGDENILRLASSYQLPVSIFDVKQIPTFEQTETTVSRQEVDDILTSLRQQAKDKTKASDPNTKSVIDANKAAAEKERLLADNKKKIRETEAAANYTPSPEAIEQAKGKKVESEDAEPAPEKKSFASIAPAEGTSSSAPTPKVAAGQLMKGDPSLPGVQALISKEKILSMDPNMLDLFSGMAKEYHTLTGKLIPVTEAFRSYDDQMKLYKSKGKGAAAKPGTSTHEFGIGIDINTAHADELDKLGLMKKYGFTRPIGAETWHLEPAGVALNPGLAKKDPAERLKRILSSPGRGGGGFGAKPVPPEMKYRRNMKLQKQLFDSTGQEVDPKDLTKQPEEEIIYSTAPKASTAVENMPTSQPDAAPVQYKGGDTIMDMIRRGAAEAAAKESSGSTQSVIDSSGNPVENLVTEVPNPDVEGKPRAATGAMPSQGPLDPDGKKVNTGMSGVDPATVKDLNSNPLKAIDKAATVVGMNKDTLKAFAMLESSLRTGVKNKASSATGLMQFVGGTWDDMLLRHGARYNIPPNASPTDPYYSAVLAAVYAKENLKQLGSLNGVREDTAMYLAHHFGAGGAKGILAAFRSNPSAPMQSVVSSSAYSRNTQALAGKTVGQYIAELGNKIDTAKGVTPRQSPASTQRATGSTQVESDQATGSQPSAGSGRWKATMRMDAVAATDAPPTPPPPRPPSIQGNADLMRMAPPQPTIPQPQQQGPSISLDKTETLLGDMGDTLVAIKTILEAIRDKGAMTTPSEAPASTPKQTEAKQAPSRQLGSSPMRVASTAGVSMSRKSVST